MSYFNRNFILYERPRFGAGILQDTSVVSPSVGVSGQNRPSFGANTFGDLLNQPRSELPEPPKPVRLRDYLADTILGIGTMLKIGMKAQLGLPLNAPEDVAFLNAANQREGGLDFKSFSEAFSLFIENLPKTAQQIKEQLGGAKESARELGFAGTGGQIGLAFIQPIGDLVEGTIGIGFTGAPTRTGKPGGDFANPVALDPVDRAAKIQNAVGAAVGIGVGVGLAKGALRSSTVAATRTVQSGARALLTGAVDETLDASLQSLGRRLPAGNYGYLTRGNLGNIVADSGRKLGIAAASGAAYSAVAGYGEEEYLARVITDGILFAPIGAVFEIMGLRSAGKQMKANIDAAIGISRARQLQAAKHLNTEDLFTRVLNIASADDILEAQLTTFLDGNVPLVRLKGLNDVQVARIAEEFKLYGYTHRFFFDEITGKHEAIIFNRNLGITDPITGETLSTQQLNTLYAENLFDSTGLFKGEQFTAGHNANSAGKTYIALGLADDNHVSALAPNGVVERIPIKNIVKSATTTGIGFQATKLSLKTLLEHELSTYAGMTIEDAVNASMTVTESLPIQRAAREAALDAETGTPFRGIAFRIQSRYETGFGRFYSNSLGESLSYVAYNAQRLGIPRYIIDSTGRRVISPKYQSMINAAASDLIVTRLEFKNPLVLRTGRRSIVEFASNFERILNDLINNSNPEQAAELRLKSAEINKLINNVKAAIDVQKNATQGHGAGGKAGEMGYTLLDKAVVELAHNLGYDGIILGRGGEIIDIRGYNPKTKQIPAITKTRNEQITTLSVATQVIPKESLELNGLYNNFKDYIRDAWRLLDTTESPIASYVDESIRILERAGKRTINRERLIIRLTEAKNKNEVVNIIREEFPVDLVDSTNKNRLGVVHSYLDAVLSLIDRFGYDVAGTDVFGDGFTITYELLRLGDSHTNILNARSKANIDVRDPSLNPSASLIGSLTPDGTKTLNQILTNFALEQGFTAQELPGIRQDLLRLMAKDLENNYVGGRDREFLDKARESIQTIHNAKEDLNSRTLVKYANANGMYITKAEGGVISIKDWETGIELFRTSNFKEAKDFIGLSDQYNEVVNIDIDSTGANIPPIGADLMLPGDMNPDPFDWIPNLATKSRLERINNALNASELGGWFTRNRDRFISFDNVFGTKLFARVFDPLQQAAKFTHSKMQPWIKRLEAMDKIAMSMSASRREIVGSWLEAMSPETAKQHAGPGGRALNPTEIAVADWFRQEGIDEERVFRYRRTYINELKHVDGNADNPRFIAKMEEARQALMLDDIHMKAFELIQEITSGNSSQHVALGGIMRLYRAYKGDGTGPALDRDAFAARHSMTFEEIALAKDIEKFYGDIADEFQIPKEARLDFFMTHARLYENGDIQAALRAFKFSDVDIDSPAARFYAEMVRTGEISAHELDPVVALQRYVKSGFFARYFNKAAETAQKTLRSELQTAIGESRMTAGSAEKIKDFGMNYIEDLKGYADLGRQLTQEVVDKTLNSLGANVRVDVRRQIVNFLASNMEAAAQGLRIAAGIRDFTTSLIMISTRFGFDRIGEVLELGVKGMEVNEQWNIPNSSISQFSTPTEFKGLMLQRARLGFVKKLDTFNQFAFTVSGQAKVYQLFHTGLFMSVSKRSNEALVRFSQGKLTRAGLADAMGLRKYDRPIAEEYLRLVDANDYEGASRFLAVQTGQDLVGVYGLANHPEMWRSNVGRIVGQFGMWPVWFRNTLVRELSRGTLSDRVGAAARFAAANALLYGAGNAMGLNLNRWLPITGMGFVGGPITEAAGDIADIMSGNEYMARQGMQNLARSSKLLIPGSFFLEGAIEGVQLLDRGDSRGIARIMGVPIKR